jgi:hypothetical protein
VCELRTQIQQHKVFSFVSRYVCLIMLDSKVSYVSIRKLTFTVLWTSLFECVFYFVINSKLMLLVFSSYVRNTLLNMTQSCIL